MNSYAMKFGRIVAVMFALIPGAVAGSRSCAAASVESMAPNQSAADTETLHVALKFADSFARSRTFVRRISIPSTTLVRFTLLSKSARLSLTSPDGTGISATDTSARVHYFRERTAGIQVFDIQDPVPGTWNVWVTAAGSGATQPFAGTVEYRTSSTVKLTVTPFVHPGDVIAVLAELATRGHPRTDVVWMCSVNQPDGSFIPLQLYDDGAHGDALAQDGIYGNRMAPARGAGVYIFRATAVAPGVGALEAEAASEVADAAAASHEIRQRKTATSRPR